MTHELTWQVREASAADADALGLIGAATFLETFAGVLDGRAIMAHCARVHTAPAYAACLADGGRAWLAEAVPGLAPVGFALAARPDLPGAQPGDWELKRIYTLSRLHGTGLGAELMAQVVAAAAGYRRLLLGVYARNTRAIAFYARQGFAQIGTRRFDVGGTLYDDVVLARPLTD